MSEAANHPAATRKAQARMLFNGLAAGYDAGLGNFAYFGRRLVDYVGVRPGDRVLDVATGRGAVLFPAAERVGDSGEVVGIDLAEQMIEATATEATRRGVAAQVRVMDAEALEFPDSTFDRVLCGFGIMFFPELGRALGEFRGVLTPGGRLGVPTWQLAQSDDLADTLAQFGRQAGRPPGWITSRRHWARCSPRPGSGTSWSRWTRPRSATWTSTNIGPKPGARGTRQAIDALDAEQRAHVRAALAEWSSTPMGFTCRPLRLLPARPARSWLGVARLPGWQRYLSMSCDARCIPR